MECNTLLKQLIHDFGRSLQVETGIASECTANELHKKLRNCSEDFLGFWQQEGKTSARKHLNATFWTFTLQSKAQRLDIKIPMSPASDADDEDEAADLKDTPRSNPGIPKFQFCKMSTYVYAAAINGSKPMFDKDNVELRSRSQQLRKGS